MDDISELAGQGADWAAIVPMIRARQEQMAAQSGAKVTTSGDTSGPLSAAPQLSDAEKQAVAQLKARDREVRDHEQAHKRVGGGYASQPTYSYQTGPDGKQYAIGGEVQIDTAPVADDPQATIVKMMIVKAAALAPAEPSSADRKVAALAETQRGQAMAELAELRAAERRGDVDKHA